MPCDRYALELLETVIVMMENFNTLDNAGVADAPSHPSLRSESHQAPEIT
jgi:hypothetical protein